MSPTRSVSIAAALLCLAGTAAPAGAEPLGRLFLTPERRAALERQRQLNIMETQQQVIEGATLTVSGVVRRSSGASAAWVNGAPVERAAGLRIEIDRNNPGNTTLTAGEDSPAPLKVGETINRSTRETTSGLGGGRIVVKDGAAR